MTATTAFLLGLSTGALFATLVCIILAFLWYIRARTKVAALKQDILRRNLDAMKAMDPPPERHNRKQEKPRY